jgi:hypothetical protein
MSRARSLAVALLSAATLAYQILLVRVFAIEHFHHFATMAIGVAMLGYGASGTVLALARPGRERTARWFGWTAALAALALVAGPALVHRVDLDATQLAVDLRQWLRLAQVYLILAGAFGLSALAVLLGLTRTPERLGAMYGASFLGAALGAVLAVSVLEVALPAHALALPALLAAAGALAAWRDGPPSRRLAAVTTATLVLAALAFVTPPWRVRVTPYKALPQVEAYPEARRVAEFPSAIGWVAAVDAPAFRHAPGLSLSFAGEFPSQRALFVDGELVGATFLEAGADTATMLAWLPAAAPYALGGIRRVLAIGAGNGVDLAVARKHGADHVVGLELHPGLARLAGAAAPAAATTVRWVIGDARSRLAHERERYDLVTLGAAAGAFAGGAGLHALSEDFLHTVEAYRLMLGRLDEQGVLAVTRWLTVPPRQVVRVILTAAAALRAFGVRQVDRALVVLRSWGTATVLIKPAGFSDGEVSRLGEWAAARGFDLDWPPRTGARVFNTLDGPPLSETAASAADPEAAERYARSYPFDVAPATDARPFPHHFIGLASLGPLLRNPRGTWLPFAEWGTVALVATLCQSVVLAAALTLAPVLARRRTHWSGRVRLAGYFSAIGLGYLAAEIAAIQQLGLLLGHPVYAVAAALVALLVCSGVGSIISDRVPAAAAWRPAALLAVLLVGCAVGLLPLVRAVQPAPLAVRAVVALLVLAPPALVMGLPFPLGLRALALGESGATAEAWAANGFMSVVAAPLAALLALDRGSPAVLWLAAGAYALAALLARGPALNVRR